MNDFMRIMDLFLKIKSNNETNLFDNIPAELLKDKSEIDKMTAYFYKKTYNVSPSVCLFPGCTEFAIESHSLQKALLKLIADNTNHVIRIKITADYKPNGTIKKQTERIGVNEASVFLGYCAKHDAEIFLPIEQDKIDVQNIEQNFLLLFRSVAREYYEAKKGYDNLHEIIPELIKDYEEKDIRGPVFLSLLYLNYCEFTHIENIKSIIDYCYKNNLYNLFEFNHLQINKRLPILVNTFTAIQGMNNGKVFRRDIRKEMPLYLSMTILPNDKSTDVYYAILKEQKEELKPFLEYFHNSDRTVLESFISDTILRNSDNFYVSPEFLDKIPEVKKREIIDYFYQTTINREYITDTDINLFTYI
ncbi:MAG: hypothetical protein A2014_11470 [Spirochaetes bacterium GWF1_49_6]|nr:MAG: hypothetical protein A2014_11470 [Spirochaetes bacterium GWF1_49_6]